MPSEYRSERLSSARPSTCSGNTMLTADGAVKVMDFGIARAVEASTMVTTTMSVIGTPRYMSPEQVEGRALDSRSDLYSLGICLYECLSGRPPFAGTSPISVAAKQVQQAPQPLREVRPDVSAALEAVTLRALEKDPDRRYQTAVEFGHDLERARVAPTAAATRAPRRTGRGLAGAVGLLLLGLAGFLLPQLLGGSRAPATEAPPDPNYPRYRIEPGTNVDLSKVDPDQSEHYRGKKDVRDELDRQRERIRDLQARLYAERKQGLLIVLQAMDTGGKDGTIRNVFAGVNPQGCQVWSFKAPSSEELEHDVLWRYHAKTPSRGMITIFNRSHYEEVLIVRVKGLMPEEVWRHRYAMINEFEHALTLNNTAIVKFYLHISKDEQRRRLQSRLDDPAKHWKFSSNDLKERVYWDDYMAAFEDAIGNCATEYAPWYVVPANNKWYRNLVIARTIADTLEVMAPRYPEAERGLDQIVIPE
jgi:PPK2 family polyphosphate:nucleotide phosphotransferase